MPSRAVVVRSLAYAVAMFGAAIAAAPAAPKEAAPKEAPPKGAAPSAPAAATTPDATATVAFDLRSVEINAAGRGALDTLADLLIAQGVSKIELRGYATGGDADDTRRLALARTLSVRVYLIDRGVKARIEVTALSAPARTGARERVDVMTP